MASSSAGKGSNILIKVKPGLSERRAIREHELRIERRLQRDEEIRKRIRGVKVIRESE